MSTYHRTLLIAAALSGFPMLAFACAGCGCTVNSDRGAQGMASGKGWAVDLRYDLLNQNQLRSGRNKISPDVAADTTNSETGDLAEVEKYTRNRYTTATLDYNDGTTWGFSLVLPYIQRKHETYGSNTAVGSGDGYPSGANGYESSASGVGDIKLIGRYLGLTTSRNLGLQAGIKLPTGKKDQLASDGVTEVDPGLQLGTGSTDLILGVYYYANLNADWDYFTQANYQTAIDHGTAFGASYQPGDSYNFNLGARYHGYNALIPTLQLNAHHALHDRGDAADVYATGGTLVYLTPGAILPIGRTTSLYANLQLPLYQDVRGIQVTPRYVASLGVRTAF
jgi:hypothetical protein